MSDPRDTIKNMDMRIAFNLKDGFIATCKVETFNGKALETAYQGEGDNLGEQVGKERVVSAIAHTLLYEAGILAKYTKAET